MVATAPLKLPWKGRPFIMRGYPLDRVSQALTGRIKQLAERYATPLPKLIEEVECLGTRVEGHLKKMGAVCN